MSQWVKSSTGPLSLLRSPGWASEANRPGCTWNQRGDQEDWEVAEEGAAYCGLPEETRT